MDSFAVSLCVNIFNGFFAGKEVFVYKKAMLLCSNLQFAHEKGSISFGVSGTKSLTVFADNVLPCVLRAVGVLRLEEELGSLIDSGKVVVVVVFVVSIFQNVFAGASRWSPRVGTSSCCGGGVRTPVQDQRLDDGRAGSVFVGVGKRGAIQISPSSLHAKHCFLLKPFCYYDCHAKDKARTGQKYHEPNHNQSQHVLIRHHHRRCFTFCHHHYQHQTKHPKTSVEHKNENLLRLSKKRE